MNDAGSIRLEPFCQGNAELVLRWRNTERVRANSLDDRVIDSSAHARFLEQLVSGRGRHYYVVHVDGSPEAVVNVDVDVARRRGRWGCYLGGDLRDLRPGLFPLLVGISGTLAFGPFDCDVLCSEVLADNSAPRRLNAFLGIAAGESRLAQRASARQIEVVDYAIRRDEWPRVAEKIGTLLTKTMRRRLDDFSRDPLGHVHHRDEFGSNAAPDATGMENR